MHLDPGSMIDTEQPQVSQWLCVLVKSLKTPSHQQLGELLVIVEDTCSMTGPLLGPGTILFQLLKIL